MASPAFHPTRAEGRTPAPRPAFTSLADLGRELGDIPDFASSRDNIYISTSKARGGAKGLAVALALESAAALCIYGGWQLLRLLR